MKLMITERPFGRIMMAITAAAALATLPSYASEPKPPGNGLENSIPGLDSDQAQAVARAREEKTKMSYSEQEEAAIDLAIGKVNEKTPVSRDTLTNIRIRSIEWPDSSLGCPEPGVEYIQKVIPGYLVNFRDGETIHTVNVGENRAVICERVNDFMLERKKRADSVLRAHREARLDLAKRLNVDPEIVKISRIKVETWPDSSLGCPQPDQQYKEGPVEGLKINMTCRDKQYEYRVPLEGGDFISCKEIISCHETE